ncbi:hypothetical protein K3495_g5163 [Podosphaera aphanis]|nr:hypothetical protein K3495_g5163 [Podosphaera aphanis]
MTGVGGIGPRVNRDVLLTGQFITTSGLSNIFRVSCGIVPDNTFPGDLTLGKGIFHKWSAVCNGDIRKSERETITLLNFTGKPTLQPINKPTSVISQTQRSSQFVTTFYEHPISKSHNLLFQSIKWPVDTPINNSQVSPYLKEYARLFPGVFDARFCKRSIKIKTEHIIDTGNAPPLKLPPRRYSPSQENALRDFVKKHQGVILTKSKSPWAAPALLTPKKTPGAIIRAPADPIIWRFYCDYRELNRITKKHAHPLPNLMDQIQRAAGHNYYCFIDLKDGFWQVPIKKEDREKTAFVTPFGIYEWMVMPFGLCNAPATFQGLMEEILGELREFTSNLFVFFIRRYSIN